MSLGHLALIVAAGLAGPLLAASRRAFVPVVVGEILAGVVLGRSGLDVVHADNETLSFLAEAGFAMLMLTVGMHVPLRDGWSSPSSPGRAMSPSTPSSWPPARRPSSCRPSGSESSTAPRRWS